MILLRLLLQVLFLVLVTLLPHLLASSVYLSLATSWRPPTAGRSCLASQPCTTWRARCFGRCGVATGSCLRTAWMTPRLHSKLRACTNGERQSENLAHSLVVYILLVKHAALERLRSPPASQRMHKALFL